MKRIFVQLESGAVVGAFCSRYCAAKSLGGISEPGFVRPAMLPRTDRGISGYAVAQICCDECGENLVDKEEADARTR